MGNPIYYTYNVYQLHFDFSTYNPIGFGHKKSSGITSRQVQSTNRLLPSGITKSSHADI